MVNSATQQPWWSTSAQYQNTLYVRNSVYQCQKETVLGLVPGLELLNKGGVVTSR